MEEGRAALQRKDNEVKEAVYRAEDLKEKLKVFIKAEADKSLMLEVSLFVYMFGLLFCGNGSRFLFINFYFL